MNVGDHDAEEGSDPQPDDRIGRKMLEGPNALHRYVSRGEGGQGKR